MPTHRTYFSFNSFATEHGLMWVGEIFTGANFDILTLEFFHFYVSIENKISEQVIQSSNLFFHKVHPSITEGFVRIKQQL